jgi:hypothetical protein
MGCQLKNFKQNQKLYFVRALILQNKEDMILQL